MSRFFISTFKLKFTVFQFSGMNVKIRFISLEEQSTRSFQVMRKLKHLLTGIFLYQETFNKNGKTKSKIKFIYKIEFLSIVSVDLQGQQATLDLLETQVPLVDTRANPKVLPDLILLMMMTRRIEHLHTKNLALQNLLPNE